MFAKTRSVGSYVLMLPLLMCCDEELPLRSDPQNLLEVTIEASYAGAVDVTYGPYENVVWIYVYVMNNYTESFADVAELSGELEITWQGDKEYRKTLKLDQYHIVSLNYSHYTGRLLLDPKRAVIFACQWFFDSDNGDTLINLFPRSLDTSCIELVHHYDSLRIARGVSGQYTEATHPRWVSEQTITITGRAKLYKALASSVVPTTRFVFTYESFRKNHCQQYPGWGDAK